MWVFEAIKELLPPDALLYEKIRCLILYSWNHCYLLLTHKKGHLLLSGGKNAFLIDTQLKGKIYLLSSKIGLVWFQVPFATTFPDKTSKQKSQLLAYICNSSFNRTLYLEHAILTHTSLYSTCFSIAFGSTPKENFLFWELLVRKFR